MQGEAAFQGQQGCPTFITSMRGFGYKLQMSSEPDHTSIMSVLQEPLQSTFGMSLFESCRKAVRSWDAQGCLLHHACRVCCTDCRCLYKTSQTSAQHSVGCRTAPCGLCQSTRCCSGLAVHISCLQKRIAAAPIHWPFFIWLPLCLSCQMTPVSRICKTNAWC